MCAHGTHGIGAVGVGRAPLGMRPASIAVCVVVVVGVYVRVWRGGGCWQFGRRRLAGWRVVGVWPRGCGTACASGVRSRLASRWSREKRGVVHADCCGVEHNRCLCPRRGCAAHPAPMLSHRGYGIGERDGRKSHRLAAGGDDPTEGLLTNRMISSSAMDRLSIRLDSHTPRASADSFANFLSKRGGDVSGLE